MVEFIGAAAAVQQLAMYGFSAANNVIDFTRRVRRAQVTQRQWEDQSVLIDSLSQTIREQSGPSTIVPHNIIDTIDDDLNRILPVLGKTMIRSNDGIITRARKKVSIVKKEATMNKDFSAVVQRSMLCSQMIILNAFNQQLQREETHICSNSTTTLAQSLTQVPTSYLSPQSYFMMNTISRNANFVGQKDLLLRLSDRIDSISGSTMAISGIGGLGKSDLIIELAYLRHTTVQDEYIFYVDATTGNSLVTGLLNIGHYANLFNGGTDSYRPDTSAVVSWLDSEASGSWLLLIDNVDVASITEPHLRKLLQQPKGCVLLTTRNRQFALMYTHPTNFVEMPQMNLVDAREVLNSYIGSSAGDQEEVTQITLRLDCHPLALEQTGKYMRSTSSTLKKTLALLENDETFLSILLTGIEGDPKSLSALGGLINRLYSMDAIVAQNQNTVAIIFILSCINSSGLSDEVLNLLAKNGSGKQALDILKSYYLLTRNERNDTWQMSKLARTTTRAQLMHCADRVQYIEAALDFVASMSIRYAHGQDGKHKHNTHMASALEAMINCTSEDEISPNSLLLAAKIAIKLCHDFVAAGKAASAVEIAIRLINWGQTQLKKCFSCFDKLYSRLSVAYHGSGHFTDAERLMRDVLWSQIRTVGENHAGTLHSLNNMGVIHQDQGRFQLAEKYHRKALEMKEGVFGSQHLQTLLTLNNLALSLQSQKSYDEAEVLFYRALRGRQRLLPSNHPDTLVSISNLGVLLQLRGRIPESQKLHQIVVAARTRILGPNHPETLKSKGNLALVLSNLGQHTQSNEMFYEIRLAYENTLGRSHPQTIQTFRNLAILLHRQSNLPDAEKLMLEILSILDEKHGKGHPETFGTLEYLATLLHLQGRLENAYDIVTWLYEMRKQVLGRHHLDTEGSRKHVDELEAELVLRWGTRHRLLLRSSRVDFFYLL